MALPNHRTDKGNPGSHACETCHSRKVKCRYNADALICTACQNTGRTDCVPHVKRRRAARRLTAPQPLQQLAPSNTPLPKTPVHVEPAAPPQRLSSRADAYTGVDQWLPFAGPVGRPGTEAAEPEYKTHLVEFVDQPAIDERPIDRAARVTFSGTDVSNLTFLVKQQSSPCGRNVRHHPSNRIARRFTSYEHERVPADALQLPEKQVVDHLLNAYFSHINPVFPIVDGDRFLAQYHARDPENPPSLLLLHAILLVGAHVAYDQPQREQAKLTFFRKAKTLFDTRFERNRDVVVQAALLLTWHSDGAEDVCANAWHWTGVACNVALGLGMHRDAEPSTLVSHNKRMWRRVWWLLFHCDVQLAAQYGRPQRISLDDCDVRDLVMEDFAECGSGTEVDYAIHMINLSRTFSQGLRTLFRPRISPTQRQAALRKLDEELASWTLRLPLTLQLKPTHSLTICPALLHIAYNTVLILSHRPRPSGDEAAHATRPDDADICSSAAATIQSIFESLCSGDSLRCLWSSGVHSLFTAMIQISVELRFSNPVLAVSAVRRYNSTLDSLRQLRRYWPAAETILYFFEHSKRLQGCSGETSQGDEGEPHASVKASQALPSHYTGDEALNATGLRSEIINDEITSDAAMADFLNSWEEWRDNYWQDAGFTGQSPEQIFTFRSDGI